MGALVPTSALWYAARGTGFVAVVMLTLSVTLGILTSTRWSSPQFPRFVTAALHKNISLLSVVFLGVHIASTILDPVSPVHLLNAIVPFTGSYRPLGIGLGVIAIDLLAALVITSLLRRRIGYRIWRAVHWSAYACWPFAMLHGLNAGTDATTAWAHAVYISCAAVVAAGVAWRLTAAVGARVPHPRHASGKITPCDSATRRPSATPPSSPPSRKPPKLRATTRSSFPTA